MRYVYECNNDKCKVESIEVNKPIADSSREEYCPSCGKRLTRVYSSSITTGDGFKR